MFIVAEYQKRYQYAQSYSCIEVKSVRPSNIVIHLPVSLGGGECGVSLKLPLEDIHIQSNQKNKKKWTRF